MPNDASGVLWRRLRYMLCPQYDLYKNLDLKGKYVLEAGFGTGTGVLQYASTAHRVIAMEMDKQAIDFARQLFPVSNVEWLYGDITSYIPGSEFNAVVMIEVLEHIPEWELALENVHKSMTPGGVLYISGPNKNADLRKNDIHEREWTAQEFQEELGRFFPDVGLYDYKLQVLELDTRTTPLIAVCVKDKKNE